MDEILSFLKELFFSLRWSFLDSEDRFDFLCDGEHEKGILSYKNDFLFSLHLFDDIFSLASFTHGLECLMIHELHGATNLGVVSSGLQMIVLVESLL